ncbi:ABC transporter substrate-binding protein [Paenibacillus albicereus]|uniref:ABC transporter substrate-binding protein n=1 Tax=Paenibacillus albicereus TaxID=2726185 RepID=A0A6H2H1G9_9BACL|nr:ABC transporter substrate-binding protein [Paenibacillus albicereus]QJC53534.1 ABC transporter substrate-binding protein [Paenibacillus albicereus]
MTTIRWNQWNRSNRWTRIGLLLLGGALAALLLAGCGGEAEGSGGGQVKLKIADISTNITFRVAQEKGFFAKHGVDAELVTFATPAEGVNALFIKQVDVAFGADFPLLNAASKGDYAIFASSGTATDLSASDWKLFVRPDVKTGADLKGKNLSFLRGTFLPYLWDVYLGEQGLKLDDVKLIGQGGLDEAYVALRKGEIDAVWVFGAINHEKFSAIDGVHELSDMSRTPVRLGTGLIAASELLQREPEALTGFLRALDEASAYAQANPDEAADILYKTVKQPKEATLKDLPKNPWNIGFTDKAYAGLQGQKKYMVDNGIIEKDFNLDDKLKLDLVRKAFPDRVIELGQN